MPCHKLGKLEILSSLTEKIVIKLTIFNHQFKLYYWQDNFVNQNIKKVI